jgi:RNA polymerase sigma-70 factor (ECF subfamily)
MAPEGAVHEPDPYVLEAARRGDVDAFAELVRGYQPDVWRLVVHLVRDDDMANDITQDAFVRAYRFLKRYRGDSKFSTWLFAIARNCARDELRRRGRQRRVSERLLAQPTPTSSGDRTAGIEVREALATLPLDLREPVVMIDMFGASYKEVGRMLKLPVGTVKSRVHRARELLVAFLAEPEEETTGDS